MKNSVLQLQKSYVPKGNLRVLTKDLNERPDLRWFCSVKPTDAICNLVGNMKEKKVFGKYRRGVRYQIGIRRRTPTGSDVTEYTLTFCTC